MSIGGYKRGTFPTPCELNPHTFVDILGEVYDALLLRSLVLREGMKEYKGNYGFMVINGTQRDVNKV